MKNERVFPGKLMDPVLVKVPVIICCSLRWQPCIHKSLDVGPRTLQIRNESLIDTIKKLMASYLQDMKG